MPTVRREVQIQGATRALLTNATSTVTSAPVPAPTMRKLFVARGSTTSGVGAVTVRIDVSVDGSNWVSNVVELSLALGPTSTAVSEFIDNPWLFVRARVITITGTGANVTVEVLA